MKGYKTYAKSLETITRFFEMLYDQYYDSNPVIHFPNLERQFAELYSLYKDKEYLDSIRFIEECYKKAKQGRIKLDDIKGVIELVGRVKEYLMRCIISR